MDPLTHTLVGVSLAATRLGEKTYLATPALVIGANLPDIDVLSYFRGSDFALGFRRGWTHGVLAMVILPALLALMLLLWGRMQRGRPEASRLSPRWLLALSYLACLTHPCLDWLNTYGMRWWMPFRDTWTYGDSVFIIDPWLWLILGLGWLIGRQPSRLSGVTAVVLATLILAGVANDAPTYLPVVGGVALTLLAAFFCTSWPGWLTGRGVASVGLLCGGLYISGMIALHALTLSRVGSELAKEGLAHQQELLVGPLPADPLAWDVVVAADDSYRWGRFDWRHSALQMSDTVLPAARTSQLWTAVSSSGQSPGFFRWTRLPWLDVDEGKGPPLRVFVMDARYTRSRRLGFGGTVVTLPTE